MKNDPKKHIFSEDLDYSKTGKQSIWGEGDSNTIKVFKRMVAENKFSGRWLNFAAGYGR